MAPEDFEQEVTAALVKAADNYDPNKNDRFQGYAQIVIKRHLFNLPEKAGYRVKQQPALDEKQSFDAEMAAAKIFPPDREAHRTEVRQALDASLKTLTDKQQYVLAAQAQGKTNPEIAAELNCSPQNIQLISAAGRKALRPEIEARGVRSPQFMPASPMSEVSVKPSTPPSKKPENKWLWIILLIALLIGIADFLLLSR